MDRKQMIDLLYENNNWFSVLVHSLGDSGWTIEVFFDDGQKFNLIGLDEEESTEDLWLYLQEMVEEVELKLNSELFNLEA